jgi:hypothetical protein
MNMNVVFPLSGGAGAVPQTAATATSALLGMQLAADGSKVHLSYLAQGISGGPEIELAWANGKRVTVLYEETARFYLDGGQDAAS